MNQSGHSVSYSFSLELKTALAEVSKDVHTTLTPQIVRNPPCPFLFQIGLDNVDQFVNDLSGAGSIYTSIG